VLKFLKGVDYSYLHVQSQQHAKGRLWWPTWHRGNRREDLLCTGKKQRCMHAGALSYGSQYRFHTLQEMWIEPYNFRNRRNIVDGLSSSVSSPVSRRRLRSLSAYTYILVSVVQAKNGLHITVSDVLGKVTPKPQTSQFLTKSWRYPSVRLLLIQKKSRSEKPVDNQVGA
jgi:hypothetical protein